jgi:hypothetical protein
MIIRRHRSSGEEFLGCSTFPACRGTRPATRALERAQHARGVRALRKLSKQRRKYRLSDGRRYAKDVPDVAELLVARAIGRNLGPWEGLGVQVLAAAGVVAVVYWFIASGMLMIVVKPIADWYAAQALGPRTSPVP